MIGAVLILMVISFVILMYEHDQTRDEIRKNHEEIKKMIENKINKEVWAMKIKDHIRNARR